MLNSVTGNLRVGDDHAMACAPDVLMRHMDKNFSLATRSSFMYIYPNKLSIESLQLMFDLEEKEEIFKK